MSTTDSTQLSFIGNVIHELLFPALFLFVSYVFLLAFLGYMNTVPARVDAPVQSGKLLAKDVQAEGKVSSLPPAVRATSKRAKKPQRPLLTADQAKSLYPDVPGMSDSMTDEQIGKLFLAKHGKERMLLDEFRAEMNQRLRTLRPPMKLTEITADGHCLYRSVAYFLKKHRGITKTVDQLRQEARNYILGRGEELSKRYLPEQLEMTFEDYCDKIVDKSRALYGGDLELMAFVERYQFVAQVYQLNEQDDVVSLLPIPFRPEDKSIDISLLPVYSLAYSRGVRHYDVVEPLRPLVAKPTAGIFSRIPESVYLSGLIVAMVLFLRSVYFSKPVPQSTTVPPATNDLPNAPPQPQQQQPHQKEQPSD